MKRAALQLSGSICRDFFSFIKNSPSVYREERLGMVHNYMSRFELLLKNYNNAVEHAKSAKKYLSLNSDNFSTACEQEFYALFYSEQYDEAIHAAENMLQNATRYELGEFHYAKYNFLHACALFRKNEFESALGLLPKVKALKDDKEGWGLGIRLLSIMACMKLNFHPKAEKEIYSLQKFIDFNKKNKTYTQREELIVNILVRIMNTGFDLKFLKDKTYKDLFLLSGNENGYSWEMLTPELIPFHEWLLSKMPVKTKAKERIAVFTQAVNAT